MTDSNETLEALTADELRRRARLAGHVGVAKMRKRELIELLSGSSESAADSDRVPTSELSLQARLLRAVSTIGMSVSLLLIAASPVAGWLAGRTVRQSGSALANTAASLAETARTSRGSLNQSANTLHAVADGLQIVEGGLARMDPLLETVGGLLGDELPGTIETARAALVSAESGAAAMDGVLRGLRILGLNYNPSQPLPDSLAQTAESLEPLPGSLRAVDTDLETSRTDVGRVASELGQVQTELHGLADELRLAADSLEGYAAQLTTASDMLNRLASLSLLVGVLSMLLWALAAGWLYVLHWALAQVAHLPGSAAKPVMGA